jgi:hypothetical protein
MTRTKGEALGNAVDGSGPVDIGCGAMNPLVSKPRHRETARGR